MVAVDDDRRPVPVPPWVPTTPVQLRREAAAERRRELRREMDRREEEIKREGEIKEVDAARPTPGRAL